MHDVIEKKAELAFLFKVEFVPSETPCMGSSEYRIWSIQCQLLCKVLKKRGGYMRGSICIQQQS